MIPSGRKFWSFTILAGAALAAFLAAGFMRRPAATPVPALPATIREAVTREALEWRSTASLVVAAANAQFAWLDSEEAVQDEARLIEVCDHIADASAALVQDFRRRAASAAGVEKGVDPVEVERFFRQTLREVLHQDPEGGVGQDGSFFQLPAVPLHSFILGVPALAPPNPVLQRILERLLQVLTRLLQILPPGSPSAAAIQRAIDAILALLGTTDTTAPVIQGLSPAAGSLTSDSTPTISGTVTDSGGSGVDANSIVVLLDGATVAASKTVVNANQLTFTFTPPSALLDGSHSVRVDAKDLAGNVAATATSSFIVDATAPMISNPQPADGSMVTTPTPTISASWTDDTSGVVPSTARILLDGADLTSIAAIGPGGFSLTSSSSLAEGAHVVDVQISDAAGIIGVLTWSFTVATVPPQPPAKQLSIEIMSGDGQEGTAGRCPTEDIVVRVFDAVSGSPIPGAPVQFTHEGGGGILPSKSRSMVTDASGIAGARVLLARRPGSNPVRATAFGTGSAIGAGRDEPGSGQAQVVFTLQGRPISLTDVSVPSTCNTAFRNSDFPGSGLPRLFTMRVADPQGNPKVGETVVPLVVAFNGAPPTTTIGQFFPTAAVTESDGTATFAFAIDDAAPVGAFTMEFRLPHYLDADGEPPHTRVECEVLDPAFKPSVRINDSGVTGQGQVGLAGRRLKHPLRAIDKDEQRRFLIEFSVIEGSGSFELGPEGDIFHIELNACGNPKWFVQVDGQGQASVRFTPGSSTKPALVSITQAHTDIFVIGPSETRFVRASALGEPAAGIVPLDVDASAADYVLEARVPSDFTDPVLGSVRSLDACRDPLDTNHPVAPATVDLALSLAGVEERHAFYRSGPLAAFQGLLPGTPSATATILEMDRGGAFQGRAQIAGLNIEAPAQEDRSPQKGSPVEPIDAVVLVGTGAVENAKEYAWTLNVAGRAVGPFRKPAPLLEMKLDSTAAADNLEANPPVIAVAKNNGNRRATLTWTQQPLTAAGANRGEAATDTILLHMGGRTGAALPGADSNLEDRGGAAYIKANRARLAAFASLPETARTEILKDIASADFFNDQKARFLDKSWGAAYAVTYVALVGKETKDTTLAQAFVLGTAVSLPKVTEKFDAEDFDAALRHEGHHMALIFSAGGAGAGNVAAEDPEWGKHLRNAFLAAYNGRFVGGGIGDSADPEEWQSAGRQFSNDLSEVYAHYESIRHGIATAPVSHFFVAESLFHVANYQSRVIRALREGVEVKKKDGTFMTHSLLGAPGITEMRTSLQNLYDSFKTDANLKRVNSILGKPVTVLSGEIITTDRLQRPE